jgi:hypothetical protein
MSLLRPTAQKFVLGCACVAGALAMLLGFSAAPAMAWNNGKASQAPAPTTTTKASTGCPSAPLSQPFAAFGDGASYSSLPGGSFEEGTAGWSLTNASVVSGNESYNVAGGSHSLATQPTGTAISPAFCVSEEDPTIRFFARQTSGSWAVLNVIMLWQDSSGASHYTTVASLQSGTAWKPSPIISLADSLPIWQDGETVSVRLVLKPEQYGGAWAVDDGYVDPRMR